ncbi:hypothetical protein MKEN_00301500 [Mycena kentingensis (nom. inval.)]|nr:hypothetical protein MKEN_00301500 [Mycena kentingensis (nom. inval.)]
MTASNTTTAPLVAVVGATGAQGGSVVRNLLESDKDYRIRAFTRDASKPAAKALEAKGVEVVQLSLVEDNKESVFEAFAGVDYAFIVTNWAEHGDPPRETREANLMIDAAKAGGARGIIWSGLPSIAALSGGKYTQVGHFESKARASEYGRASGVPFVDIQAGGYMSNLVGMLRPQKISSSPDVWALNLPTPPGAVMPMVDAHADYGLWVRKAIESEAFPDGQTWATGGENVTMAEQMRVIAEYTGKNVIFNQITPEVFGEGLKAAGIPPHMVPAIQEVFTAVGEFGYYAKDTIQTHEGLARKPRTFKEFVEGTDWSTVLV